MRKVLRRALTGGMVLVILGLILLLTFPSWSGFGSWIPLPEEAAPRTSVIRDSLYADAARGALRAIAEHREEHGFPGITASVAIEGEIVWTGSSGWADLETMTPVSSRTVMRIGSTSKAVTATVLARLLDTGRVGLDDSLSVY